MLTIMDQCLLQIGCPSAAMVGSFIMRHYLCALAVAASALSAAPATAGIGDLLVAPTRVILNGGRGTEIILKNVGDGTATYRVSAELRRMTPEGKLIEVTEPNATGESGAGHGGIRPAQGHAGRPTMPQAIRVSAHAPAGLADGEYRVHLLFRAIPDPKPVSDPKASSGLAFQLIPIYGVTIPVIVRLGNLTAKAGIADVHPVGKPGADAVSMQISRQGERSIYGEIRVIKAGVKDPVAMTKGVAIYPEINGRTIVVPRAKDYAGALAGPVTVQFFENSDTGPILAAETSAVLR